MIRREILRGEQTSSSHLQHFPTFFHMNMLLPKNIKSNYFMHPIIVLNLPYYTSVTITVTFVNQVTLSRTFLLFPPENYPHKSGTIFQINVYVFYIHTEIPNGTHKLHHVKRSAVFQKKQFKIP
jgi:hypothetical protein